MTHEAPRHARLVRDPVFRLIELVHERTPARGRGAGRVDLVRDSAYSSILRRALVFFHSCRPRTDHVLFRAYNPWSIFPLNELAFEWDSQVRELGRFGVAEQRVHGQPERAGRTAGSEQ